MADEAYYERLIEEGAAKGTNKRHSDDISDAYNKHRNHFSKSTAQESDLGVRDIENLLRDSYKEDGAGERINPRVNGNKNRFSSVVGSI